MSKIVHIVSFDVPFPADYGGVIDVFSRVKWFSENGWQVKLHCFEYKRPKAAELDKYAEVHYYKRPLGLRYWFSKKPFIVNTRINKELEEMLKNTSDEVILEGLHCAHYLNLQAGKFYLRAHNIEHEYYSKLAENTSFLRRIYYRSEANKLKAYESVLAKAKVILAISEIEAKHFLQLNTNTVVVPPILELKTEFSGTKPFVLFHGSLFVEENREAVDWILNNITSRLPDTRIVIAGKDPSTALEEKCIEQNVELYANPSQEELEELVQTARVHLLYTNNDSGLKLKFLNAMNSPGHIICSKEIVAGSGLKKGFHLIASPTQTIALVKELLLSEMSQNERNERIQSLQSISGDQKLAELFK